MQMVIFLFICGSIFGSFGYVLALRYDGNHFLLDPKIVGGRSYCPHCKRTLRWFELIPFVSFVIQGGRCRNCKTHISFAYPLIEVFSGLFFVCIALRVQDFYGVLGTDFWIFSILWIAFFFALVLLSIIDVRLGIIPDELVVFLCAIAVFIIGFWAYNHGVMNVSFFGPYATFLGLSKNIWLNHIVGALFGILFFGGLVILTHGKGMGMGDVKLAVPLGFILGWPDVIFLTAFAFVSGAAVGLVYISRGIKTMKSALPFGPFLALGVVFVFFFGYSFITWYFRAMGF